MKSNILTTDDDREAVGMKRGEYIRILGENNENVCNEKAENMMKAIWEEYMKILVNMTVIICEDTMRVCVK